MRSIHRNVTLACILLLAFVARYRSIDRFETGYDELFSVLEANGYDLSSMQEHVPFTKAQLDLHDDLDGARKACIASDGGNGILYVLLLHAWTELLGNSNLSVRSFSLTCGLLVVLLLYTTTRQMIKDDMTALVVAGLGALAPLLVDYSQEARGYMLSTLFVLLATRAFLKLIETARPNVRQAITYGLLAGLSILTHYSSVYVLLAHATYALLWVRTWGQWRTLIGAGAICAVPVLLWLSLGGLEGLTVMADHNQEYRDMLAANPDYHEYFRASTPQHLAQDTLVQFLWLGGNALQFIGPPLRILMLSLVIPCLLIAGAWKFREPAGSDRSLMFLVFLSLSGPCYALLTSALAGHTFGMRYYYMMFSAPFILVLLGLGTVHWLRAGSRLTRSVGTILLALQLGIMLVSVNGFHVNGYRGNSSPQKVAPAARMIDQIVANAPPDRFLLIHQSDREALALNLHLGASSAQIVQRIDGRSPYATVLVGERNGIAHLLFKLSR